MSAIPVNEVFTIGEVARAAGVPADAVRQLLGRGELSFVAGTRFISVLNPVRTARRLQEVALTAYAAPATAIFTPSGGVTGKTRKPAFASLVAHATLVLL